MGELNGTRHRSLSTWALRFALGFCLAGYVFVYTTGRAEAPIRSDGFSYYVYLPSWFLFHDTTLSAVARDCCGGVFPAISRQSSAGRRTRTVGQRASNRRRGHAVAVVRSVAHR